MTERIALMEALIRPKLLELKNKLEFWVSGIDIQEGQDWITPNSLTLEKFLAIQPCPKSESELTIYGIAWEFIWGEKPPEAVTIAKEKLIKKAESGKNLSPAEELWINLIFVGTDYF